MRAQHLFAELLSGLQLRRVLMACILSMALVLAACAPNVSSPPTPTTPPLAKELSIYYWEDGIPQEVLDAFTAEYGVKINYKLMVTYEEAIADLSSGKVYDVMLFGNVDLTRLIREKLLAKIDKNNIRNFKNLQPNFRDLAYDPGNQYTVPFVWGTTGIVYRKDLVAGEITSWRDLWDPRYKGKVGFWQDKRTMIGLALQLDGHSVNTENPDQLEAAYKRLIQLKGQAVAVEDIDIATAANALANGTLSLTMGWSYDWLAGQELNKEISYALPQEGTLLWSEDFVIPANSPNKYTAELFIDFMLRGDIGAKVSEGTGYATTNALASKFIDAEMLKNTVIFPTSDMLKDAEVLLPVSPEAEKLYDDVWNRFIAYMRS